MAYQLGPAMFFVKEGNLGTAQITTSISADATEIELSNVSGNWPSAGLVKIEDEWVLFRAFDSDNNKLLRCVRGFYSTTAAAHDGSTTPIDIQCDWRDLGKTHGGATLAFGEESQDVNTDQDGDAPVDVISRGVTATLTANLADITLENFALVHKGTIEGTAPKRRVVVASNAGCSTLGQAKPILVVPLGCAGPTTASEETYYIPRGGIIAKEELAFNRDDQRVIAMEVRCLADDTVGGPVVIGDASEWL